MVMGIIWHLNEAFVKMFSAKNIPVLNTTVVYYVLVTINHHH